MNQDELRQEFEAWYNSNHKEPINAADRRRDGDYRLGISGKWQAYQACNAKQNEEMARDRALLRECFYIVDSQARQDYGAQKLLAGFAPCEPDSPALQLRNKLKQAGHGND